MEISVNIRGQNNAGLYNINIDNKITINNVEGSTDFVLNITKKDINPYIVLVNSTGNPINQFFVRASGTSDWIRLQSWDSSVGYFPNGSRRGYYLDKNSDNRYDFMVRWLNWNAFSSARPHPPIDFLMENVLVTERENIVFTASERQRNNIRTGYYTDNHIRYSIEKFLQIK